MLPGLGTMIMGSQWLSIVERFTSFWLSECVSNWCMRETNFPDSLTPLSLILALALSLSSTLTSWKKRYILQHVLLSLISYLSRAYDTRPSYWIGPQGCICKRTLMIAFGISLPSRHWCLQHHGPADDVFYQEKDFRNKQFQHMEPIWRTTRNKFGCPSWHFLCP